MNMTRPNPTFGRRTLSISTLVICVWLVFGILIFCSSSPSHRKRAAGGSTEEEIEACLQSGLRPSPFFWKKVNLMRKQPPETEAAVVVHSNFSVYQNSKVHFLYTKPELKKNLSVLLLHGQAFTSDTWKKLNTLQNIAAFGYEAIALDLPGFGMSPVIQDLNKDDLLSSVIATLGLKNVVVVSPSMSGVYSMGFLRDHPDELVGLVAVAPMGTSVLARHPCRSSFNASYNYFKRDCQKVLKYLPSYSNLDCIKVPTLIVFGENDRGKNSARLCLLPNSQGAEIPHGEHAAYLSNPHLFHKLLYNFLDVLSDTLQCTARA